MHVDDFPFVSFYSHNFYKLMLQFHKLLLEMTLSEQVSLIFDNTFDSLLSFEFEILMIVFHFLKLTTDFLYFIIEISPE